MASNCSGFARNICFLSVLIRLVFIAYSDTAHKNHFAPNHGNSHNNNNNNNYSNTIPGHGIPSRSVRTEAHSIRLMNKPRPVRSQSAQKEAFVHRDRVEYHASPGGLISPTIENEHMLRPEKCIPIEIPLCKNIGYNLTYMPNAFHHETQEEAGLEVHQFYPLVEINCSEDLRLFLCSMYTPICLPNWRYRLTACRSLCESARDGCMPVMKTHGFSWPERMNCDLLPEGNECVSRRNSTSTPDASADPFGTSKPSRPHSNEQLIDLTGKDVRLNRRPTNVTALLVNELLMTLKERYPHLNHKVITNLFEHRETLQKSLMQFVKTDLNEDGLEQIICLPCRCRDPFVQVHKPPLNEVVTGGVTGCMAACRNPLFDTKSDKTFTTFWLGLWAVLCTLSTLATVMTFIADPGRFQYPERPIIYLSACYLMVAIGFLVRVGMGHESVACDGPLLRRGSTGPTQCSVVFLLTYVFGMASSVWWVILTLTWFLAAGLKWGSEAIAKYSQLYHFIAWFIPGAQAILILILSAVDGDPVGGLCYVGSTDLNYLRLFVLAPMCIYLGLGTAFLLAGFVALFKIRSAIKLQARGHLKTNKLEKLMIRIGIFGVLYTVPATVVIGCICYELLNREIWQRNHNCPCIPSPKLSDGWQDNVLEKINTIIGVQKSLIGTGHMDVLRIDKSIFYPKNPAQDDNSQPEHAVFMLKYFMSLVVGITSGFWIWSSKTLDSWQSCFRRVAHKSCSTKSKRPPDIAVQTPPVGLGPTNRSPIPPCSIEWGMGHSKNFVHGRNTHALGMSPTGLSSCNNWPDEMGPTTRLLPQPPPAAVVNMTCNHSFPTHIGLNTMGNGSANSMTGVPGSSAIQVSPCSFPNGSIDGVPVGLGTMSPHTFCTMDNRGGPPLDNGTLHMIPATSLTHI